MYRTIYSHHQTPNMNENNCIVSSRFVRQGFGRVSTTSGKFNLQKRSSNEGSTKNTTVQHNQGLNNNTECNRTLNYTSYYPIMQTSENCENQKTLERRYSYANNTVKECTSVEPTTAQCKVPIC